MDDGDEFADAIEEFGGDNSMMSGQVKFQVFFEFTSKTLKNLFESDFDSGRQSAFVLPE